MAFNRLLWAAAPICSNGGGTMSSPQHSQDMMGCYSQLLLTGGIGKASPLQHSQALMGCYSEYKDLVVVGKQHLHKQVNWSDGIEGHLTTPRSHQVGAKHHSKVARCHLVEVTAVHHLQENRKVGNL